MQRRVRMMVIAIAMIALCMMLVGPVHAIKVYVNPSIQTSNYSPDGAYQEAANMQDVASRLVTKLLDRGFEARNSAWLDLGSACVDSNNWGSNCFVAIHSDATGGSWSSAHGSRGFYHQNSSGWHDDRNITLAADITSRMAARLGAYGRGYNLGTQADYPWLGWNMYAIAPWNTAAVPATLIEGLYHTNWDDVYGALLVSGGRDAYAQGVLEGICDYYGWAYPSWASTYRAQSYPATMVAGTTATAWVEYNNTGNTHWFNGGKVRLGTQGPQDRNSPFYTPGDWDSALRPGSLDQADVAAGGVGRCTFTLTAPSTPGTYTEQFKLVRENVTWFGDTITWVITVTASDSVPPSTPTNLTADPADYNTVHLTWTASTDNVGVTGYEIWRNGTAVATVGPQTSYDDTTCSGNTSYSYQVRARDGVGNWSGLSSSASALTWTVVAQDSFANLSQWLNGPCADGTNRGVSLDTGTGNPSAPSARSDIGVGSSNGSYSYIGFSAPFQVASIQVNFYDSATSDNSRNGIALRKYDGAGATRQVYVLGTDMFNTTNYCSDVYSAAAGWNKRATAGARTVGWKRFKVAMDTNNATYYVNNVLVDTIAQPAEKGEGMDRFYIGSNYNVNTTGWYDDFVAAAPIPPAPTAGSASGITTGGVTWSWTEGSKDNEQGFYVRDTGGTWKATAARNVLTASESGLAANTLYTRKISAYNGTLESAGSGNVSATTLSVPPTVGSVSASPAVGVATTGVFTFTSASGFGAGTVHYYRYAFDSSATHSWTGGETQWSSGNLVLDVTAPGNYYLHLKGYNSADVENGTVDIGPFVYAAPVPPTGVVATSANWNISHVMWTASSDPLGVSNYEIWRNGAALTTVAGNVTSFDDSNLSQGTTYTYQIKAKNGANHWSDLSTGFGVKTWSVLLNDPFANLNSWTASKVADGTTRGCTLNTGAGSTLTGGSGAPSGRSDVGSINTNGSYSYNGVSGSTFAVGYIECSIYDGATSGNSRNGIAFRKSTNDDILSPRLVFFAGVDSVNSATAYSCEAYGVAGGWVKHATGGTRTVGWHRFRVGIDGTNITYYVDGTLKDTITEPAEKTDGVNRWYIGNNYNVNLTANYDDFFTCMPTPPTPTPGTPSGITSTSITWNFTEGPSDYEQGFYLRDTGAVLKGSAARGATSITESGLSPNTTYYRTFSAYNGSLESPVSVTVSATTAP